MPSRRLGSLLLLALFARADSSPLAPAGPLTEERLPSTLLIRVVDAAAGRALPNAEVTAGTIRRLTDARGEARLGWPAEGTLGVRVRQLGFRYVRRTLHRGTSASATEDTVVVALERAAFALPQIVTRAQQLCAPASDSAALALSNSTMELLRFGAEQYNAFRATYPFAVTMARNTRSPRGRLTASRSTQAVDTTNSDDWGGAYIPGRVLQRTDEGYFLPLLFVSTLADSAFWDRHCFTARGVESHGDRRLIRLDFTTARGIRDVEWEGSAWLDSAASVLARVDFRLTNLRGDDELKRLEGYTIFSVPSPFIAIPDSTVAHWWSSRTARREAYLSPDAEQVITVRGLRYRRGQPPAGER